jgi:hypothetical protein
VLPVAAIASLLIAACGGGEDPSGEELFSGDGFGRAHDAVREEAGADAPLLRVQVTDRGAEFQLLGEEPRGLIYTGEALQETEILAPAGLAEAAFPLSEVDPEAIGRLVDSAKKQAGGELTPVAVTLERSTLDGELRWTLNAQGGLAYSAGPDGADPAPAADASQQAR